MRPNRRSTRGVWLRRECIAKIRFLFQIQPPKRDLNRPASRSPVSREPKGHFSRAAALFLTSRRTVSTGHNIQMIINVLFVRLFPVLPYPFPAFRKGDGQRAENAVRIEKIQNSPEKRGIFPNFAPINDNKL